MGRHVVLGILVTLASSTLACNDEEPPSPRIDPDGDADGGADGDADGDSDSDAGFNDADVESDRRGNIELAGEWTTSDGTTQPICRNGDDEDEDGLWDCADLGCLGDPLCCVDAPSSGIEGAFAECTAEGLETCGWTQFQSIDDGDALRLNDDALILGGDGEGEVGIYSEPLIELAGEPYLTFVASLQDTQCATGNCPQVFGVALSAQQSLSSSTGVQPTVGVVLDGELGLVHFFNGGRIEHSQELIDLEALTRPLLYGLQLNTDGSTTFWGQQSPDEVDDTGKPTGLASYRSMPTPDLGARQLRVVAFGRLSGDGAQLQNIHLKRRTCDIPDGWSRASSSPVLTPLEDSTTVRRPSVMEIDDTLAMVFERHRGLALATSTDGLAWESQGAILQQTPSTEYGLVSISSPTVLAWAPVGEEKHYYLWYRGEAERGAQTPEGVTPTAILQAVSEDGFTWREAEVPIAFEASGEVHWLNEVDHPTVAEDPQGGLRMWFVGSLPYGTRREICSAHSSDGKQWVLDEGPISYSVSEEVPLEFAFERDGRSEPAVLLRQGVFHMWYVGSNGGSTSIGYAVSGDGIRWERFGQVLGSSSTWESRRLGGPSVISRRSSIGTTDILHLYYHGGTPEMERVGVALREVPIEEHLPSVLTP